MPSFEPSEFLRIPDNRNPSAFPFHLYEDARDHAFRWKWHPSNVLVQCVPWNGELIFACFRNTRFIIRL